MTRQPQPDDNLERAAWIMREQTAKLAPLVMQHLSDELSLLDGWGTGGDGTGRRSADTSTSVERAALARNHFQRISDHWHNRYRQLVADVSDFNDLCRRTLGDRAPRWIPEPCDGRRYEGFIDVWVPGSKDERNGWSDASCREVAGPSGLCLTCRARHVRWRERNNLPPLTEEQVTAA